MKKVFKNYAVIWAVLLVVFNVIAFVSPGWITHEKYTASFWIGYVFITLAFLGQLACAYVAFKAENLTKLFYNLPLFSLSYTGLIVSFVVGGLCMLISPLPYWVGAVVSFVVACYIHMEIYVAWHQSVGLGNGKFAIEKRELMAFENDPACDYKEILIEKNDKVYMFRNETGIASFFEVALPFLNKI